MNDITPRHADDLMRDFEAIYGPHLPIDLEAVGASYLANAKRESAIQRWTEACPPDMRESNWDHPSLMPFATPIRSILGHPSGSKGLLASGPTGRGKSRAMWQRMRVMACDEGIDCSYWHSTDFFSTLQSFVNFGRDDASGWIEAVARRRVVFVDDFGQEAILRARSDWAQGWFFRFLDIRVGEKLPLYITTNLRGEDIAGRDAKSNLRADPLLRRLLDLCAVVRF